ncbi:MAG: aldehyde dehydrogenase family protein [Acidimicrobiia bacterium]|nr:aldehyde dehydrogenase family protein [Acidimicrobiia bacterium]MYC45899.1 aldehyde dehydrogenase family protein [Acidimicrobiia bacterium]MYI20010.1 aldehyde dehydrogenase family protein [Acidimicrobiia bacterium]
MQEFSRLYIGGEWVVPSSDERIEVVNAFSEEVMGRVPAGGTADVDRAVAAARAALAGWSATPLDERLGALGRIAEGIMARNDELARSVVGEVGTPSMIAPMLQTGLAAVVFGDNATLAPEIEMEATVGGTLTVREPIGVVGAITPWNFPLVQIAVKVAPALAMGCTVIVKPSEYAPLTAFMLAEIVHEAGVPPGVFNLVSGEGPSAGEALVAHPDVDMVSFTGSTATGRRISAVASSTVKKVTLELGGKSPLIVLDGAPLADAVAAAVQGCYINCGQMCTASTRLLVPETQRDEAVATATAIAESLAVGDPAAPDTMVGPLVNARQRDRVRDHIQSGIDEGATLVTGGVEPPDGLERGYFVRPTVFADVTMDMRIAREEIFGPVLSILTYTDTDDAVRIANDTDYGLAAMVFGEPDEAMAVARRLRAGWLVVNGADQSFTAPYGGYKQSGLGKELGVAGLEEYLELKAIHV